MKLCRPLYHVLGFRTILFGYLKLILMLFSWKLGWFTFVITIWEAHKVNIMNKISLSILISYFNVLIQNRQIWVTVSLSGLW